MCRDGNFLILESWKYVYRVKEWDQVETLQPELVLGGKTQTINKKYKENNAVLSFYLSGLTSGL